MTVATPRTDPQLRRYHSIVTGLLRKFFRNRQAISKAEYEAMHRQARARAGGFATADGRAQTDNPRNSTSSGGGASGQPHAGASPETAGASLADAAQVSGAIAGTDPTGSSTGGASSDRSGVSAMLPEADVVHTAVRDHPHRHADGTVHTGPHFHLPGVPDHGPTGSGHPPMTAKPPAELTPITSSVYTDDGEDGDEEGTYEDTIDDLEDALQSAYGQGVRVLATRSSTVIYKVLSQMADAGMTDDCTYWRQEYTLGDDGEPVLGTRIEVEEQLSYQPVSAMQEPDGVYLRDISPAERVALAKKGQAIPIRSDTGEIVGGSYPIANAADLEAAVKAYGRSPDAETKAHIIKNAKRLGRMDLLPSDWPGSTQKMEDGQLASGVVVSLRLADGDTIPDWQVYHRVGDWGEHPIYGRIKFTHEMGDQIIRNFRANVLGRGVPLDAQHGTDKGSPALGWAKDFRWGRDGEGLPGSPEPAGTGDLLYTRMDYTPVGRAAIKDELYRHQSPQYAPNYNGHGAVAQALAATNNPFLKHNRTLQGQEQQPVRLDDGLTGWRQRMPDDSTVQLEEQIRLANERATVAEERANAATAAIQLRDQEIHRERIDAWAERARSSGVPEVSVRKAKAVLLQTQPRADGVIALDEAKPDDKVNLYEAILSLMADFPVLSMRGGVTSLADHRPPDRTPRGAADVQLSAEDEKTVDEAAKWLVDQAGVGPGRAGVRTPANGAQLTD